MVLSVCGAIHQSGDKEMCLNNRLDFDILPVQWDVRIFKLKKRLFRNFYSALVDNGPSLYLLLILPIFQHQSNAALLAKASPALGFSLAGDGHMTPEEVERHLQSRQSYLELLPERAPPTVPTEMFSNDPSLDRYAKTNIQDSLLIFRIRMTISATPRVVRWALDEEVPGDSR